MRGNTRVAHQVPALDQDRYDALFFVCSFWLQNWRFSCLKICFFFVLFVLICLNPI